ncbi:PTS galactitol transporter subunit IIC [Caproiciproducens galactitolivorans]|uniref:Galactitol permease IIC component n=1 Tax=Caproiciproducens galactitolivorans TaxID=642589 RepID=A0A4Z0YA01_9FIRM|nr:PTS transporter subunit IIC [Caproiciproducens galactitolivorans]QEY34723.1 PTS galactitol transporter subunit IIC [Caproiciproducens galactitolivorans]TGJ75800.1 galactitol permease IIC component [Caproiciproducens galactitolivorans]
MFFTAIKTFFDTFGSVVFVPVVIFIMALALKVPAKKAFMSALSAGVGLEGFNLVIGAYSPIITPIINQLVKDTGIKLNILDMGWQTTSIIAYSTNIGMIYLVIAIVLQIVLFLTRYTNVFQAGDLWNNYSYMAWGSVLFLLTGNFALSLTCMIVQQLYTLCFTEVIEERWSKFYHYPNCTIASLHTATVGVYAVGMNWLLNRLGLYKVKADPDSFRKRFGFLGEPMTLGLLLGLFIGIVGNIKHLGELKSWGTILVCGVATASVMAVFPKISSIFAGSFGPITEASKKSVKGTKGEWYLAVNDACGYGETATLISGIVLMPIVLIISFILPGNQTLPMLDLVAIPYCIQPCVACSNGNMLKSIISGGIFCVIFLYCCTMTGSAFTEVAKSVGTVKLEEGVMMITSFIILGQPVGALIFMAFLSQNPIAIAAVIIIYVVCYVFVRKNRAKIHAWIEEEALNPGHDKANTAPAAAQ